jgi:outer membrane lipoprotein-sorting protein
MNRRLILRLTVVVAVTSLTLVASVTARPAQTRPGREARIVDPKALPILEAMDAAFLQAQGLVATYRNETFRPNGRSAGVETTTLRLGRPNVYYMEMTTVGSSQGHILASNGTTRFDVMSGTPSRCSTSDVAPLNDTREIDSFNPLYWSFYDLGQWQIRSAMLGHWVTKWRLNDPGLRSVRYVGRENVSGVPVDVVEWTYTIGYSRPEDDPLYTSRLSIGIDDHFIRRIETTSTSKNEYEGRRIVETVTDIRATPRPAKEEFEFRPPAGATCTHVNAEDVYTTGKFADLPIGSKAPDFTLKTSRGETIHFSEFLAQHKVLLMNYWGYG